ncbi:MAG: protein kinase [Myxococcota bacterium]
MRSDQYKRAYAIFMDVVDLAGEARQHAIDAACQDDDELRTWVGQLLSEEAHTGATRNDTLGDIAQDLAVLSQLSIGPGTVLDDRFEVMKKLGKGGMAEVWLVRHLRLRSLFALKVISNPYPWLLARFLQEGRLQARVRHPNIVHVFDTLQVYDRPALVMEYVQGADLSQFLKQTSPTIEQLDALAWDMLSGMQAVHDAQMVHRDLKPANILLVDVHGRLTAKIADFGLAKRVMLRAATGSGAALTRTGMMMGTPAYMSPEQISDPRFADARSDIWALGCVLHEMLTGELAFDASNNADLLVQILTGGPNTALTDAYPARWRRTITAALQRDPDDRPQSCAAMLAMLEFSSHVPAQTMVWPSDLRPSAPTAAPTPTPITQPPPPTTPPPPNNLRALRNRFVGRQADLDALRQILQGGGRLITVLGIGGLGKSRLSQELGRATLRDWPGGVWFVELADARTAGDIWSTIGEALDLRLGQDPQRQITHDLRRRGRTLLILDNFEQIADFAAETAGALLDDAAQLSILVTSRTPLQLSGERIYTLGLLEREPAIALFIDRAQQAKLRADLSERYAHPIAELVERLDRLPLAIELAAARSRMYTPDKLLSRLSRRFDLLQSRSRDRPARQRTLRAALQWSWEILSADEQAVLAQCSVFEGGMSLEDAVDVIDIGDETAWLEELLAELVDHSLLVNSEDDGDMRLSMLVSVQQFASEKLQSPEATYMRHLQHFARRSAEKPEALFAERENLMAACQRAVSLGAFSELSRCARAVAVLYSRRGPYQAGAVFLEALLDQIPPEHHDIDILRQVADLWADVGRLEQARQRLSDALQLATQRQDRRAELSALVRFGFLSFKQGDYTDASRRFAQARDNPALPQAPAEQARLDYGDGLIYHRQDALEDAMAAYQSALALMRRIKDEPGIAVVLGNIGRIHRDRGHIPPAIAMMEEALQIEMRLGNDSHRSQLLSILSTTYHLAGRVDDALASMDAALVLVRMLGSVDREISIRFSAAWLLILESRLDEAMTHVQAGLALIEATGLSKERVRLLYLGGEVHRRSGALDEALTFYQRALDGVAPSALTASHLRPLQGIAQVHIEQEQYDKAVEYISQMLAFARRQHNPRLTGMMLTRLGELARLRGDLDAADAQLTEGMALMQTHNGTAASLSQATLYRARLHADRGEDDAARQALTQARAIAPASRPQLFKLIDTLEDELNARSDTSAST